MYNYLAKDIPLLLLKDYPDKWTQYPSCQRDFVWKPPFQERLIDTILRQYPIPPLVVVSQSDELSATWLILDGQQRIETIRRYLQNRFSTARSFRDPGVTPMCPGCTFDDLPSSVRNTMLDYTLRMDVYNGLTSIEIENMFRRLQYAVPLSGSEKLWSYSGHTKTMLLPLLDHSFFSRTYKGAKDRKENYQMLIMCSMMELMDGFCNLTTSRLKDMASSVNKLFLTSDAVARIRRRLDYANEIFGSADISGMAQIIPVYQACYLLQMDNYRLTNGNGLGQWFNELKAQILRTSQESYGDGFARLTKVGEQRKFWEKNILILLERHHVVSIDNRRRFNMLQRLEAYNMQGAKCAMCGKAMIISDAVADHVTEHASGGQTTDDNCKLYCKACHEASHKRTLFQL